MAKVYTAKKKIKGTEYTAQFNGISAALRAADSCYIDGTSNTSTEKMAEYLLENVIVDPPHLSIDDFDSMEEFSAVISFARQVMQGEFRDKTDAKATKGTRKE